MSKISIIIPTYNESGNIKNLIERIHNALSKNKIKYEIIFIDDNSTDNTLEVINSMNSYSVGWIRKKGKKGKAQSIIEGISHAKNELIAIIDADLQYPPEAIPGMLDKITKGADIVVADRKVKEAELFRNFLSSSNALISNKFLHGFEVDVQSGLKVFKKEITERIPFQQTGWTFDLNFLISARDAGYVIVGQPIIFSNRNAGKSKINVVNAAFQIGLNSLKLKLKGSDVIPFNKKTALKKGNGFHYKGKEFIHYSELDHSESAFKRFSSVQIYVLISVIASILLGFILNWHATITLFISSLTILYFTDLLFNLYLISRSYNNSLEVKISDYELQKVKDRIWPKYTILCPLYKEWQVVPQFMTSMSNLDYPKDRLQVMLLLEEDDTETIDKIGQYFLPSYFKTVVVPHSFPKTKPKACNYGLLHSTGEYVVIYDAEDVPDTLQLKKAVLAFESSDEDTVCIQAKLNFYNPSQNILTRAFTAEYSLWFDLILTGLQSVKAPIPLGGTSNHFRKKDLSKFKGWDSFNVTEDADLGMRIVKNGYKTAIIDSLTLEEANSDLKNWFSQRSRWVKGYIQTYLVHIRNLSSFFKGGNKSDIITFQFVIGGKILSMFINPLMWLITIFYFLFRTQYGAFIESFFPLPVLYMGVISLVLGNFIYFYSYMLGCIKHEQYELVKFVFLIPIYWLAMSVAAWLAVYDLIVRPHHWAKTKHGLHLQNQNINEKENASNVTSRIFSPNYI